MNTASEILVIIVSVALSIFLIVGIMLMVQVMRLVKGLQEIADRAEKVLNSAESIGQIFRKTAGPVSLFNFVRSVVDTVAEHKHKGER
jgi:uncharacterized protein with PQ loop repeat